MKLNLIILSILIFFSAQLFSQPGNLNVNVEKIPGTDSDFSFILDWNSNFRPTDGILLEIPESLEMIPVSVQINGQNLWLLNDAAVPVLDSVVAWQAVPEGLLFLYPEGLIESGTVMSVRCNSNPIRESLNNSLIQIRDVTRQPDSMQTSEEVFVSGIIPSISNQEE